MSHEPFGKRIITLEELDAKIRKGRVSQLMSQDRYPAEEELTIYGMPVSTFSKEELHASVYLLARENKRLREWP